MKRTGKLFTMLMAVALFAMALVGCSAQDGSATASVGSASQDGSASSASGSSASTASDQTKDELLAEVAKAAEANYKSLTMDGCMAMSTNGSTSDVPFIAKMDLSGSNVQMYMAMQMATTVTEAFVDGDNVTMIMNGALQTGSASEMGLSQYMSTESLLDSVGGGFVEYPDAIKDISKSYDGEVAVYEITVDAEKIMDQAGSQGSQLLGTTSGTLEAMEGTIRVGEDGRLSEVVMDMTVSGQAATIVARLYDYDKTVIPPMPGSEQEKSANPDKDAVYVMTESINYGSDVTAAQIVMYNYADNGDLTDYSNFVRHGNDLLLNRTYSEYDENGWRVAQSVCRLDTGEELQSYTHVNERDDQGRVVKSVATAKGGETSTVLYEYYDNGALKSITTENASGSKSTEEFDEDGFRTCQIGESSQGKTESRFTWEKDSDGKPTGYTMQAYKDGKVAFEQTVDIATDAAGNVVQVNDRSTGAIITRVNWKKIGDVKEYGQIFYRLKR